MLEFLHSDTPIPWLTAALPPADFAPSAARQKEYYNGANRWAGLILSAYQAKRSFSGFQELCRQGVRIGVNFEAGPQNWQGVLELGREGVAVQGYHSITKRQHAMRWQLAGSGYRLSGLGEERMSYSREEATIDRDTPVIRTTPCVPRLYEVPHSHTELSSSGLSRCGIGYDIALGNMAIMVVRQDARLIELRADHLRS